MSPFHCDVERGCAIMSSWVDVLDLVQESDHLRVAKVRGVVVAPLAFVIFQCHGLEVVVEDDLHDVKAGTRLSAG